MATDLRDKLRQLGVTKGSAHLKPSIHPQGRRSHPIEKLFNGQVVESTLGRAFLVEERYAPDHPHGHARLAWLLEQQAGIAAQLGCDPALAPVDLSRCVFLDTETTGLAGGTGTLAFLVGIGSFEAKAFCVRQFFLRDPDEEAAMLAALCLRARFRRSKQMSWACSASETTCPVTSSRKCTWIICRLATRAKCHA
jgi:hypothetical protein